MNFSRLISIAKAIVPTYDNRYKHVAFIIKSGKIRSVGWNKHKSHPKCNTKYYEGTGWNDIHAELDACIKYGKDSCRDHILVVLRIRNSGQLGLSKPCAGCTSVITQLGFKKVYYSTEEQTFTSYSLRKE